MHGALTILSVLALIGFAFGERTARVAVAGGFIIAGLFFAYVMFRVIMGTI